MLDITSETRVFLKTGCIDGRLGIEGLRGLVNSAIREDARAGHLFVFCNRRANRVKLLWYHEGGFYLAAKRLDRSTVDWPRNDVGAARMSATHLQALLKGVEFRPQSNNNAPRYRR
jgi:transposase